MAFIRFLLGLAALATIMATSKTQCCSWCNRSFAIDNPILARRGNHPLLQRRSARALECCSCVGVLSEHNALEWATKEGRQRLKASLTGTPVGREEHLARIEKYESDINEGHGKKKGRPVKTTEETIIAKDASGIRAETPIGVFWPSAVYKSIQNKAPPAKKKCVYKGTRGLMLPTVDGCPDGCTRLFKFADQSIERTALLLKGSAGDKGEDADAVWSAAQTCVSAEVAQHMELDSTNRDGGEAPRSSTQEWVAYYFRPEETRSLGTDGSPVEKRKKPDGSDDARRLAPKRTKLLQEAKSIRVRGDALFERLGDDGKA